jgi:hypothetical protein
MPSLHTSREAAMEHAAKVFIGIDPTPHLSSPAIDVDTFDAWIEKQLPGDEIPGYSYEIWRGRSSEEIDGDELAWEEY